MKAKSRVFTGTKFIVLTGKVIPFKEDVQLFNHGRKWWLRYAKDRNTGSFSSRKKAEGWYNRGGR